ncbi:MAG: glutamate synthase [Ruminococcus sp.]|nr:glutamate synthase [Ruminococcus sp.]
MKIQVDLMHFQTLNEKIKACDDDVITLDNCIGQRYIAAGKKTGSVVINGTPGNALGAYLDGCDIVVNGNAQDACGDTMNKGSITVHGSAGDATGYAMRGGAIYVRDNSGYRTGIHMKSYMEHVPALIIGGKAGSFLGEYQAGGYIVVLGIGYENGDVVGRFCGTGMHGGKIFLRTDKTPWDLPAQVKAAEAKKSDMDEIAGYVKEFCKKFDQSYEEIMSSKFFVLTPDTKNPYKQLYTEN